MIMKVILPPNLMFNSPCIYPNGEKYLMIAEEEKLYVVLNSMPVIGAGRRFSLRVRKTMCVLENNGNELKIPETFLLYLPGDSAMVIETEEFLFGKQYRLCSIENGKEYIDAHTEQQCKIYICKIER